MARRVFVLRGTLAGVALINLIAPAYAQDANRSLQISAEYSALGLVQESARDTGVSGLGMRVDYRLTRHRCRGAGFGWRF